MPNTTIYYSPDVLKVRRLHKEVLSHTFETIFEQLSELTHSLYDAAKRRKEGYYIEFANNHPDYLGKPKSLMDAQTFSIEDCQLTIARECGFYNWSEVVDIQHKAFDKEFEQARELLINGKLDQFNKLLLQSPYLIHQHSDYGHHAGLIHYIAANGVELWNQYTPSNIVEITQVLMRFGANIHMRSNIYGGSCSLVQLIETSAHPWAAGVGNSLLNAVKS